MNVDNKLIEMIGRSMLAVQTASHLDEKRFQLKTAENCIESVIKLVYCTPTGTPSLSLSPPPPPLHPLLFSLALATTIMAQGC